MYPNFGKSQIVADAKYCFGFRVCSVEAAGSAGLLFCFCC